MTEFMKQVLPMLRSPHRPEEEKQVVERRLELIEVVVDGIDDGERRSKSFGGTVWVARWPLLPLASLLPGNGLSMTCVDLAGGGGGRRRLVYEYPKFGMFS